MLQDLLNLRELGSLYVERYVNYHEPHINQERVDPFIRPEVWNFLLGCYTLSSTANYRSQLRTARTSYPFLGVLCYFMNSLLTDYFYAHSRYKCVQFILCLIV